MSTSHYLKIQPNQVYTVALKYPKPTEVRGLNGKQLRWILLDGRALYTPLFLAGEFEKLGLKPGHRFTIQKSVENGKTQWKVDRAAQQVVLELELARSLNSPVPEPLPDDEQPLTPALPPAATNLEHALKTAVHAAAKAEKHGLEIGYTIRFTPADIRAMAISVLIQMERAA